MTGTIKEIFRGKPYCLLQAEDQTEIFCHANELKEPMQVGRAYRFTVLEVPGKFRKEARNVVALSTA